MLEKKTLKKGVRLPQLTKTEEDIYLLITTDFLTAKQIAIRRETSPQAVYLIKNILKKKGYLDSTGKVPLKYLPPVSMVGFKEHKVIIKLWRYHALHFTIKPYYFFPRYHRIRLTKGNYGINHREWIIKLHPDMVEMQLKQKEDFSSPDKWEATRKAEESFNRTLGEISNKYGFAVYKEGKANIRLVNHHLARNPSELANSRKGQYLTVRGHDNKIWFQIDKSKGNEHEYTHSDRALTDSEKVEPYFNDMLYKQPPTLTELMKAIHELTDANRQTVSINKETAAGLNSVVKLIRPKEEDKATRPQTKGRPSYIG